MGKLASIVELMQASRRDHIPDKKVSGDTKRLCKLETMILSLTCQELNLMLVLMLLTCTMETIGLDMTMRHLVNSKENSSISWTLLELLFGPLTLMITEEIMENLSLSCMLSMLVWNLVNYMILSIHIVQELLQCVLLLKLLPQSLQQLLILDLMNVQKI